MYNIKEVTEMQAELENSGSSRDGDDELVILEIKPPQTSTEVDSVLHHKHEKKKKHSKECKANKKHRRHHHNHKYGHLKTSNADFSDRNHDKESKPFHYRNNKRKNQNRESEKNLLVKDMDMSGIRSKKLTKEVIESDREESIKYNDVRHIKFVKDIKENRRYNNKNEERSTYFLEKLKLEWRNKRLQWLQHKKNRDPRLWDEKEDLQLNNCEKEANKYYKNMHMESLRNENNTVDHIQNHDEEYTLFNLVSSEEDSMDHEENAKNQEFTDVETENVILQENSAAISDISNSDNNVENISDESIEIGSTSESEKAGLQKESLFEETVAVSPFKKENLITKSNEGNEIPSVSGEKCPILKTTKVHTPKLPVYCPAIQGCRSIDGFQFLNRIEEGTYGVVYRARDKATKEIVALKRLKMEREKEGFPITSLREINTLLKSQHPNIVTVREIVVGSNMDRIYIVMDYVEHDLKSLMKTMPRPFLIGEVKTILVQLLCAVAHLHDNWILHRDLKTSNLLLSHQGILKVGDFGLAREYGSPLKSYTPVVVTLWYRSPELLLGAKKYSTPIDMWSVGCVFGELLTKNALFPGKSESDQINRIFKDLGTPSEKIWPGYSELPLVQSINITQYPYNNLKSRFSPTFTDVGFDLLNRFLTYNPARRISAEKAKSHEFFSEKPRPIPPNMFPTWPAKSEQEYRTARSSPKPPLGGINYSRY